jgi:tetratricopeptide (TPR) repeat protein
LLIDGNGLCTQCHNETGRPDFPSLPLADYDSAAHNLHAENSEGASCISCHMPERTYMVVDPRRDHSFRIPRPDLTTAIGVPNTCNACHDDQTPEWAAGIIADRFGADRNGHFGSVFAAARNGEPNAEAALAAVSQDEQQPAIVRATAMSLMAAYGKGVTGFALEAGLRDPNPLVRIGALRGAQRWEAERRWRRASHLLSDATLAVRVEASRALMDVFMTLSVGDQATLRAGIDEYLGTQRLNADRAEAQTNMATAFVAVAEPQNAEHALLAALELNPVWVPALVNLADLYRATDRDVRGGELLMRAVRLAPDVPDVLLAQAMWMVRQDRDFEAMTLLERASQLAPQNSQYTYVYAVALHSAGQSERALDVLDKALLERPKDQLLLRTGFSIARELQVSEKMNAYLQHLESI